MRQLCYDFALMKPIILLINTTRGELIVQEDLTQTLNNSQIVRAGLDTMIPEPVTLNNSLLNLLMNWESR